MVEAFLPDLSGALCLETFSSSSGFDRILGINRLFSSQGADVNVNRPHFYKDMRIGCAKDPA